MFNNALHRPSIAIWILTYDVEPMYALRSDLSRTPMKSALTVRESISAADSSLFLMTFWTTERIINSVTITLPFVKPPKFDIDVFRNRTCIVFKWSSLQAFYLYLFFFILFIAFEFSFSRISALVSEPWFFTKILLPSIFYPRWSISTQQKKLGLQSFFRSWHRETCTFSCSVVHHTWLDNSRSLFVSQSLSVPRILSLLQFFSSGS